MHYKAESLKNLLNTTGTRNGAKPGELKPVRPHNCTGFGAIKNRIKDAWKVVTGEYDTVSW